MESKNRKSLIQKKVQKYTGCSYCHKLVCVDDKFSQPFKT